MSTNTVEYTIRWDKTLSAAYREQRGSYLRQFPCMIFCLIHFLLRLLLFLPDWASFCILLWVRPLELSLRRHLFRQWPHNQPSYHMKLRFQQALMPISENLIQGIICWYQFKCWSWSLDVIDSLPWSIARNQEFNTVNSSSVAISTAQSRLTTFISATEA